MMKTLESCRFLAGTVTDDELLNLPTETLITRLFHEEDVRLFSRASRNSFVVVRRKKRIDMLRMLGDEEIISIVESEKSR